MRTVVRASIGLAAVLASIAWIPPQFAQAQRPNILFILADDLDAGEVAYLPKTKSAIADRGAMFSNYFVSVSLCCPSRSTMLRGQYSHNTGVKTNGGANGGFETAFSLGIEKSTMATWLQAAGYRTALYGKYLNGYPETAPASYIPPGWSDWASAVAGNAYSEYNYALNENGRIVRYRAQPSDYGTDVYAAHADAFIRKAVADRTPFFVYLALYAPHAPATPAPRHENLFPNARAPRTPSFNEMDVSDKPAYVRNRMRLAQRGQTVLDELYRKRLQSLQAVDDAVASLVETLKATGQLENTFIVFASDNGFHMGQHRLRAGKQTPYEEDIHVPLMIRGPGVPERRTVLHFAGNIDIAPTFAEMAGAAPPEFVDGRSLMPLLRSAPLPLSQWRQVYLIEHWPEQESVAADGLREPVDIDQTADQDEDAPPRGRRGRGGQRGEAPSGIPEYHGLRTSKYTYVEYVTGERELYDIEKDPYQLDNIAPKAGTAVLQPLASRLKQLASCTGASCREAEK